MELLAGFEQVLEATKRSLTIARELAEAHRDGRPPHEAVITTDLASIARDEDTLQAFAREGRGVQRVVQDALRREMSGERR